MYTVFETSHFSLYAQHGYQEYSEWKGADLPCFAATYPTHHLPVLRIALHFHDELGFLHL